MVVSFQRRIDTYDTIRSNLTVTSVLRNFKIEKKIYQHTILGGNIMIIAIDGLGVNGKSTLAKRIAEKLNFKNFGVGAIYRCIALRMIENNLEIEDIDKVLEIIKNMDVVEVLNFNDVDIKGISFNSNTISSHEIFVCLKGEHVDGHDFAQGAFEKAQLHLCVKNL